MGVIFTENLADGIGAFSVGLVRGVACVVHGVDYTAVNRL